MLNFYWKLVALAGQPEYGMCEFVVAQCSRLAISDHQALTNFKARVHTQSHMQVTMLELRRIYDCMMLRGVDK